MPDKKNNSAEANKVLRQIANMLLDENVEAKVETTYYALNKDNDVVLTTEPGIPTKLGEKLYFGGQTLNANRARSIKIGKFTMRKGAYGNGFIIITPEGKDYFFEGSLPNHLTAAVYVWAAALAKCDKHHNEVLYYLKDLRSLGITEPKMTKGQTKTKFEEATEQMESLGIPKESQVLLQKMREGRE